MPGLDLSPDPSPDNANHQANAFAEAEAPSKSHGFWYFGAGFQGLQRQGPGHGVLAILDPGNNIPGFPPNAETGIPPPNTAPTLLNFADIAPNFSWGTKVTVGYHADPGTFEFTGYYLGLTTAARRVSLPGQVDVPFFASNAPLGFQGINNLWLQADYVAAILQTRMANAEFNYRTSCGPNVELITGIRYMDLEEGFSIFTDDVGIILPSPDPFAQALYSINTHNRIVAPQLGLALEVPLVPWLSLSLEGKGAWGANFLDMDHILVRGDGFVGPSTHSNRVLFSQIYDLGVYANVRFGDHIRIQAGYQALWVVDIPVAAQQVDFNLNDAQGRRDYRGSIFFHGPSVEIQFAF